MSAPRLTPYALVAIPFGVLAVFTLAPTVVGLALAFFWWDGSSAPRFVGLGNFRALAGDETLWPSLRNTLVLTVVSAPLTTVAGFLAARALHAPWFVGRTVARAMIFLPTVVSTVAIGMAWRWLLDDQAGPVSAACRAVGWVDVPNFLQDSPWNIGAIIVVSIWRGVGFAMVLYLAALSTLNPSLDEAAVLDGASPLQVLRHVTWPQVGPTTAFLLTTGVIGGLQVFDLVFVMTNQAESDATRVLNLGVYRQFSYAQYGYAAALGAVIFALALAATGAHWLAHRASTSGRRAGA